MNVHLEKLSAFCVIALGSLFFVRAAGAQDETKPPIVVVEIDRTPLRIDMELYRKNLRASLERVLAGEPTNRPADRVANAEPRPRG